MKRLSTYLSGAMPSAGAMEKKIERIIDESVAFDKTANGMDLKRLKGGFIEQIQYWKK